MKYKSFHEMFTKILRIVSVELLKNVPVLNDQHNMLL